MQEKGNGFARPLNQSEVQLYLETVQEGKALHRIERDEFLLFFKLYDPVNQRLSFLGRCFAKKHWKLPELVPFLNKIANFPEDTALEVCSTLNTHCHDPDGAPSLHCSRGVWG